MKIKHVMLILLSISIFLLGLVIYQNQRFVDDYLYIWNKIENYYPFYDYDNDYSAINLSKLKDKYYQEIKFKVFSNQTFYFKVDELFNEMNYLGHLSILDGNACQVFKDIFKQNDIPSSVINLSFEPCLKNNISNVTKPIETNNEKNQLKTSTYLNGRALMIQLPEMNDRLINELKTMMDTIDQYDFVIFDLKNNQGGDDQLWIEGILPYLTDQPVHIKKNLLMRNQTQSLLKTNQSHSDYFQYYLDNANVKELNYHISLIDYHKTIQIESEKLYKGDILIMSYAENYSSTINFLETVKQNNLATIIGNKAFGDYVNDIPAMFSLPNSKMVLRFSLFTSLKENGLSMEIDGFEPDIIVNNIFDGVFNEIQRRE